MQQNSQEAIANAALLRAGALLRLALGLFGLVAFVMASLFANEVGFLHSGVIWLVVFCLKAGFESYAPQTRSAAAYLSPVLDIVLVTLWLAALSELYGGTPAASLKAPGFVFYFPLILGAALWMRVGPVLFAGGAAILAWLSLMSFALWEGVGVTLSYTYYLRSFDMMVLVELEKLLSLAAFTALLALMTRFSGRLRDILPDDGLATAFEAEPPKGAETLVFGPKSGAIRVFAAEDNGVNRMVLEKMLDERGYDVTAFEDGDQLTRSFRLAHEEGSLPDMILLDLDMPIMGGIDATRWLRQYEEDHALARIPILAVTAQSDDVVKAVCEKAGMDGHLTKPVSRESLFSAMLSASLSSRGVKS